MKSIPQLLLSMLAAVVVAGCDSPNTRISEAPPARKFVLSIQGHFKTCEYSDALANWTNSLVNNLGYNRSKNICMEFLRTDIPLSVDGTRMEGAVFVSRENPQLFFVSAGELLVDFNRGIIGTGGCGGMSKHKTPSEKMWVILVPSKGQSIYGVTLGDDKMDLPEPSFANETAVTYFYH